jgi:hypothetical protein
METLTELIGQLPSSLDGDDSIVVHVALVPNQHYLQFPTSMSDVRNCVQGYRNARVTNDGEAGDGRPA